MSDVKVAFLTDSCSDIPQELTDKYGIDVIGFHIMLDGKEYLERKDITNNQFYEMMRQSKSVPTTAAITQLEWVDIYAKYVDAGIQDLVHLCINAGGSSTYNNAVKAAELLEDERPGHKMKIHLIDSHTTPCRMAGICASAPARCVPVSRWMPACAKCRTSWPGWKSALPHTA